VQARDAKKVIRSVIEPPDLLELIRARVPGFHCVLGCILLLPITLRVSKLDRCSRYRWHFENPTHGVTDRRVLIIEKDSFLALTGVVR